MLELYDQIPSFSDYAELTVDRHYVRLPADWSVVVADIAGSTEGIAAGRYRDVNTIGAACIAVVLNALGTASVPYVFGGDGASLVLPPDRLEQALRALAALQDTARTQFKMVLRLGVMSIREVEARGGRIEVARYEIKAGRCIALFRGGGLTLAERCIKADPEKYAPACGAGRYSLEGLSCRWNKIPSRRGQLLSLLVQAPEGPDQAVVYGELLGALQAILDGDMDAANPVDLRQATYKTIRQCVANERRFERTIFSLRFAGRVLEIIACVLVFRLKLPVPTSVPWRYAESMRPHADYRKFDDMLRMVIDCSPAQAAKIEALLEARHAEGALFYGLHPSGHALMTCLVGGLGDGKHIHFIDGDDGGYAMAARQLKSQQK